MAVLLAEGFTAVPRAVGVPNATLAPSMALLGWSLPLTRYNGTTTPTLNEPTIRYGIEPDPTFSTRNVFKFTRYNDAVGVSSLIQQAIVPVAPLTFTKFVLGMTVQYDCDVASSNGDWSIVAGPGEWTNSQVVPTDTWLRINWAANQGDASVYMPLQDAAAHVVPGLKRGMVHHIEFLIETDIDRCRVYINAVLVGDFTYTPTFSGFSLLSQASNNVIRTYSSSFANVYCLGLDSTHTGILGPKTRIVEVAPSGDVEANWIRSAGFSSNAEVLQKLYSSTNETYVYTGETVSDFYASPNTAGVNATAVYGVAFKTLAMTMGEGTHKIASATRYGGSDGVGPTSYTLTLSTLKPLTLDASVNPSTGVRWTPTELNTANIGMKLVS